MKLNFLAASLAICQTTFAAPADTLEKRATVQGFDISHYQTSVNFKGAYSSGARFVIIKVTFSHRPVFLVALQRRNSCGPDPRWLPLRPSKFRLRRNSGQLLHRPRRRLVRRRHHTPRHARHRIQSIRSDMLRAFAELHGQLDPGFRQHLP